MDEETVILPPVAPAPDSAAAPGWYGKLPSLGDFASRRLPPSFIQPWDDWLASGLHYSKCLLQADWLDIYLTAGVWRFVLGAGVLDANAYAGILLPSVDRVGRYFPLTIASAFAPDSPTAQGRIDEHWMNTLEQAARAGLSQADGLQALEQALTPLRPPLSGVPEESPAAPLSAGQTRWQTAAHPPHWHDFVCQGMPSAEQFARMLEYTPA